MGTALTMLFARRKSVSLVAIRSRAGNFTKEASSLISFGVFGFQIFLSYPLSRFTYLRG